MNSQHIVVLCACSGEAEAERIARALVTERLAACVNRVAAMRSTYIWEGQVRDEAEVLLVIKTLGSRYVELETRIRALHGYDVPEIIALPIQGGSGKYLAWLAHESSPAADRVDAEGPRAHR